MKTVLVFSVVLWMLVGGIAAYQRGDFASGNCSTVASTAVVVALGAVNYLVPESLNGTCAQPTDRP